MSGFQEAMAVLGKSDRALFLCVKIFNLSSEKYRRLQPSPVEVVLGIVMRISLTYVKCRSLSLFTTTVMSLTGTPDRQFYGWKEDKKRPPAPAGVLANLLQEPLLVESSSSLQPGAKRSSCCHRHCSSRQPSTAMYLFSV